MVKAPDDWLGPYSLTFRHEKQDHLGIIHLKVQGAIIPAHFWPEFRNSPEWIPARCKPH